MPESATATRPDGGGLDVSVVLPVYNEKGHLTTEVDRIRAALEASEYSYEIIVVDDGSSDGSEVEMAKLDGVRLIRHAKNRGSGAARRTGTSAARGRVVVWTDADMTYPNDRIPELVKELDGWDHVVGARRTEEGTLKVFRVPAKWFIRKLASYLAETDIKDLNSGLRAFRRDVAMQYVHHLPAGFSCVTTLTMSFLGNGYSVKYVPIDYFPAPAARSSTGGATPSATCCRSCAWCCRTTRSSSSCPSASCCWASASASSPTTGSSATTASPPTRC